MTSRAWVVLGVLGLSANLMAQQAAPVERVPIPQTMIGVNDGRGMFNMYCAVCHGVSARGDGPAARALKTAPADLTRVSARNNGTFPAVKISRWIAGVDEITAHGNREMPTWGVLFQSISGQAVGTAGESELRVNALVEYIKSMQRK